MNKIEYTYNECYGERFIGAGMSDNFITINGTPGNALGAYLNGAEIKVNGNVQDAVGDTMNDGKIVVFGNAGDALGYAMRGGKIFVEGDAGYRAGIHMKQYEDKKPVIVIGGSAGSFLGEYLAGGLIIVLGLEAEGEPVGYFTGTGMHGGKILIRTESDLSRLPAQVAVQEASEDDLDEIRPFVEEFIENFGKRLGLNAEDLLKDRFLALTPNAKNPYKQLYVIN